MASANVLRTIFTYPISGLGPYTIAFDYLARKFVQVTLIGADRKLLVLNTDYRFSATKAITLLKAAPAGYTQIEIRRYTDATDRLVDFQDGSILRATDLNVSQVQTMHIAEEGRDVASNTLGVDADGNLDARGRKMVNLVDGVNDGDAVTIRQMKSWSDSAKNQATAAATSASAAKVSETNSKTSETNSKTSETNSGNSASLSQKWAANPQGVLVDATRYSSLHYSILSEQSNQQSQQQAQAAASSAQSASSSASSASGSASTASDKATVATQQADRAKTEADKLGNFNQFGADLSAKDTSANSYSFNAGWSVTGDLQTRGGRLLAWSPDNAYNMIMATKGDGYFTFNGSSALKGINLSNLDIVNAGGIGFQSTASRNATLTNLGVSNSTTALRWASPQGSPKVVAGSAVITTNSNGDATVGFAEAFTTRMMAVLPINGDDGNDEVGGVMKLINYNSARLSNFDIHVVNRKSTQVRVNYIAIGY